MDDYVVRVDQHPVRGRKPFDSNDFPKSLLDLVGKLNGHGRDLARRPAGGDDHMVGDVRLAGEGNGDDLDRLVVIERLKHEAVKIFDVSVGRSGVGAGLSGTFGQEVSLRTKANRDAQRAGRVLGFGDASWGAARG